MGQPRFLADHDLNEYIISGALRREPLVSIRRLREVGLERRNDRVVLEYARREGLIVVSHDANTMPKTAYEILAEGQTVTGLLIAPQSASIARVIDSLVLRNEAGIISRNYRL
jgi:hypothetical protein